MMNNINFFYLLSVLVLSSVVACWVGCNSQSGQSEVVNSCSNQSSVNKGRDNQDGPAIASSCDINQLPQGVSLDLVNNLSSSACNQKMRDNFCVEIANLSQVLSCQELNQHIKNMMNNINCQN